MCVCGGVCVWGGGVGGCVCVCVHVCVGETSKSTQMSSDGTLRTSVKGQN